MSETEYTIDDLIQAVSRKDVVLGAKMDIGSVLFYLHMAYAMGMGLRVNPPYDRIAELDRIRPRHPDGMGIRMAE